MYRSIRPGKTWLDNNGKRIQAHGGSLLYAQNKFWWYGENKEGITGKAGGSPCPYWHHGVKLYSSTDLYNWIDEGFAVRESTDENNPFYPAHIMDRPHILFNETTKQYVLWAKTGRGGFDNATFSICTGDDLHDMTFVKEISPAPYHAGDFDLFQKDGKAYIVYENPHTATICQELTEDYLGLKPFASSHLEAECPPFVREAPAYFTRGGRDFLLTSGTTGYYPTPTEAAEMESVHGLYKNLGEVCVDDGNRNSFHAQFSSVFRHPFKQDLYIALGDRWIRDLPPDLPDMCKVFYGLFSKNGEKIMTNEELALLTDDNTSEADYVWLPVQFRADGTPYLAFLREWSLSDFT